MSLIDTAKQHYADLANAPKRIEVPEWPVDGKPTVLYATPLTLSDRAKAKASAKNDQELAVEIILLKVKDADDKPVFSRADKFTLLKQVDGVVLDRIAMEIVGERDSDIIEGAEKN